MSRKLVAVYGTLKREGSNYHVTEAGGGVFLGTAKTIHDYCMYGGWGFPRVTQDAPICPIHVEVFDMDSFAPMDSLEGHPNFFKREQIPIVFNQSAGLDVDVAWMYFHPPMSGKPHYSDTAIVEDGLWPVKQQSA